MNDFVAMYFGWWNWQVSARFRALSLGSVWLLILGAPFLGPFVVPLGALRMAIGTGQFILNHWLGRRHPLGGRRRLDWALLLVTFAASCAVAQVSSVTGSQSALLFIPVALPFSAIQWRMCRQSHRAHLAAVPAMRSTGFERSPAKAA